MPRKKASPKTQDPDPPNSMQPSSNLKATPEIPSPKEPRAKKTGITNPLDKTSELTLQSTNDEPMSHGASNEPTPQGISSDPTPIDASQATPQDTSNEATPTTVPIPSRPRGRPGPKIKYKARDYTRPWRKQFEHRWPTTLPDGSLVLCPYVPLTHYYQTPAQHAAIRAKKKQDPGATQDHDNQDHENQDHDTTNQGSGANQDQEQDVTMSITDTGPSKAEEEAFTESAPNSNDNGKWKRIQPAKKTQHPYFRRDINAPGQAPGDEHKFLVDLPAMEDAYLQEAFPYRYPFDDDDKSTKLMPIEWYLPQGPFAAEDFFSMQKLQYSSSIIRTMRFRNEGLPLEQYYAQGFEMASRVVLDRERSRVFKEHKAARRDDPLLQPTENLLASTVTAEGASSSALQTPAGQSPVPTSTSAELSTSASTSASTPVMTPSGSSTAVPSVTTDTQGITSGQTSGITLQSRDTSEQPVATVEDASAGTQKGNDINLLDYYQVNKFLASVFETDSDVRSTPPVPLSEGACRILQTLLGDIETKIVAMGCHRQRKELTRLLAEKDAFNVQIAEKAAKAAKDSIKGERAAQVEKAATAEEDMPSASIRSPRRGERKRKKMDDETPLIPAEQPKMEQTIKSGYRYERLRVNNMDEYMDKWVQTQYTRARESSVDPSTMTSTMSTTKKRKFEPTTEGKDQIMSGNGPETETSATATPRERTPSNNDDDKEEPQVGQEPQRGSKPLIDDPMRVGTSMDPFLKARDFLANRFFQEQARNAAREPSTEGSQSAAGISFSS